MSNLSATPGEPQFINSPFGGRKTAQQFVQLSIDPSQGLTRKRYGWYSDNELFSDDYFSEVEAGISLETDATETAEARIRSSYPGQYISQALAQPGLGLIINSDNVVVDADGLISLTHGEVYGGAFYWDSENDQVHTGLGYKWDIDGWEFFVKSLGEHLGPSPVTQAEFGIDSGDGKGNSGQQINPAFGYIFNFPYTWYNEGPLSGAFINPKTNRIEEMVRVSIPNRPSLDTPNLPPQLVVRNNGTADPLNVELGGMQFTTYGASLDDVERRPTDETRELPSGYVDETRVLTENGIDPTAGPGKPIVSFRREPGRESVNVRGSEVFGVAGSNDIWLFTWDEWEPETALTGADFTDPVSPNNSGKETHLLTDTQATAYSPTVATFRGMVFFEAGQGNNVLVTEAEVDERLPLEATRIYTAVNTGSSGELEPFKARIEEGY